jgi:predicted enzyme related to lactoylglutathione lyase
MSSGASTSRGRLIWHHHVSDRAGDCADFYSRLFGWSCVQGEFGAPGEFFEIGLGENGIGNLSQVGAAEARPARWEAYANVADLSATLAAVRSHGGEVLAEVELPAIGARFARVRDPHGGLIRPWQGDGDDAEERVGPAAVGTICWNELASPAPAASRAFHAAVFGWDPKPLDPGDEDAYSFMLRGEKQCEAAIARATDDSATARWTPFVSVEDPEAMAVSAEELGARTVVPLTSTPGGRFVILDDPAGARFAVYGQPS